MKNKIAIFLLTLCCLFSTSANAWIFDGNKFVKAKDFNNGTYKGFNIGAIKSDYDDRYLKEISETGANIVRVLVPFEFCIPDSTNELKCIYEVKDETVKKVKEMNKKFAEKNIKVIISAFFYEKEKGDFWKNKMLQNGMSDAWTRFADQIKDDENIAALDIYYAPDDSNMINPYKASELWSVAGYNMIKAIRKVDSNHAILFQVPKGQPNNAKALLDLDDQNVVFGFDMFYPEQITLQGIGANNQVLNYPLGAEFALDPTNSGKVKIIDETALREYLQPMFDFKNTGKPVFISSWGIVHYAPHGSGYRYLQDMLKILNENDISWAYYGFRINKELDPFIAGDTINDQARTPEAPMISLLMENMKKK